MTARDKRRDVPLRSTSEPSHAPKPETPRRTGARRKIVELDEETFHALVQLGRDRFASFQELADEAFADLLVKHRRPVTLRDALKQSVSAAKPPGRAASSE